MFSSKFSTGILKHPGYNIGGGIGEAALFGAAFGGAKALATGEDPLEGALIGGVTGGAMNAATGAILGTGTEALPTFTPEVTQAYEALPANTVDDLVTTVASPQAQIMAQNAENMGIAATNPNVTSMMQNLGRNVNTMQPSQDAFSQLYSGPTSAMSTVNDTMVKNMGGYAPGQALPGEAGTTLGRTAPQWAGEAAAQQGNAVAPIVGQGGAQVAGGTEWYNKPGFDIREALGIKPESMTGKVLQWTRDNPIMAGAAGYGLGALTQKPYEAPVPEKYKSKLAHMSADYQPLANPTPVYPRFAEGGIAAMADGGINMPTRANVDFMGGDMYPQSQQQRSFYATPTQMPTSAQQAMASYEAKTNPLTGQPVANMAEGGIAGYSLGGYADGGNPRLLKGPGDGMSDNIPATIGHKQPARLADGEFVVPADVVSHLGNGSTDAGAKHLYNMMDKVRQARTGTKKQGKQIKADKYLPA